MWTGLPRQISDSLTNFSCVCVLDCFQFQNTNQIISFSKSIMTEVHEYRIIWSDWVCFSNSRKGPVFTWLDFTAVLIGLVGQGSRWLLFIRSHGVVVVSLNAIKISAATYHECNYQQRKIKQSSRFIPGVYKAEGMRTAQSWSSLDYIFSSSLCVSFSH